jgi:hypothetical protein
LSHFKLGIVCVFLKTPPKESTSTILEIDTYVIRDVSIIVNVLKGVAQLDIK